MKIRRTVRPKHKVTAGMLCGWLWAALAALKNETLQAICTCNRRVCREYFKYNYPSIMKSKCQAGACSIDVPFRGRATTLAVLPNNVICRRSTVLQLQDPRWTSNH